MPRNKRLTPRTLLDLDDVEVVVGEVDPDHAAAFPDDYDDHLNVEPQFGRTPGDHQRHEALRSNVPSRILGEPDLSGFTPPPPAAVEQRILMAAIQSSEIDPEAFHEALRRFDELARQSAPKRKRGQHKGQERVTALRGELILSIYACSGRTGVPVEDLVPMSEIPDWWVEAHKGIAPEELREESRRTGRMAFYRAAGGFQYRQPLQPSTWNDRWQFIRGEEKRETNPIARPGRGGRSS